MRLTLFLLVLLPLTLSAQSRKQRKAMELARIAQEKADAQTMENLKTHVQYLADDKLEGRSAGSAGEALAMQYISQQFSAIGLEPKGTDGYIQQFVINDGKEIGKKTFLNINSNKLVPTKEYFPLAFSATKNINGMPAMALREKGVPWFIDVKNWLEENKDNPHFDIYELVKKEAEKVATKGATALFLFNSSQLVDNIRFNGRDKSEAASIPVVFVTAEGYNKYLRNKSELLDIEMNVDFIMKDRKGHNVIGYIDNKAPSTVVIGAHFDHLGWGDDANALDTGKVIHNGADDNASGTSAMIEIARTLSKSKSKNNNYLFIAFSGEELGLLGSKYWLENQTISTPINYMVNLDMVGRYDEAKKLQVGGYGTSPTWSELMTTLNDKTLQVKYDSTGGGPSDHASFYRKDLPVLFFFTGNHMDYHKASDDWDKINFDGEVKIVNYITRLVEASNDKGKLAFLKTSEPQIGPVKFSVSLGIIPDYSSQVGGLRIDGVSPKKLAERLGLQAGDILTQLGPYRIDEIQTYMLALSHFKPGDKTVLKIKRGTEDKEFPVEF